MVVNNVNLTDPSQQGADPGGGSGGLEIPGSKKPCEATQSSFLPKSPCFGTNVGELKIN